MTRAQRGIECHSSQYRTEPNSDRQPAPRAGELVEPVLAGGADGAVHLMGVSHHDRRCVSRARAGGGDEEGHTRPAPTGAATAAPGPPSVAERASAASAAISAIGSAPPGIVTAGGRTGCGTSRARSRVPARDPAPHTPESPAPEPMPGRNCSIIPRLQALRPMPTGIRDRRRRCAAVHRSGSARVIDSVAASTSAT